MAQPFIGQLQCFGFGFAPKNWALCNGQLLPVQQNAALFSLLGVYYGGNGSTTFALPNLQSRVPMHFGTAPSGNAYVIGQQAGEEQVTLLLPNLPAHTHGFVGASANGTSSNADPGVVLATSASGGALPLYATPVPPVILNPACIAPAGSTQRHNNLQPYLTINWCIALRGIFPSRN
ncbi:MAG: tail fiber protein [Pseudolabrys sp.]|nr:tail fiber protein [Pseudolabrys sp.]